MGYLWVGAGGICGALLRYQLSKWIGERFGVSFPWATLSINVTGSFLLGLFTQSLQSWFPHAGNQSMLLLGTGFCGAYTTFSTFQYELTILLRERRVQTAALYIATSLTFGFSASAVGLFGLPLSHH
jgi:fluoride exporter